MPFIRHVAAHRHRLTGESEGQYDYALLPVRLNSRDQRGYAMRDHRTATALIAINRSPITVSGPEPDYGFYQTNPI
jgi:hypothetical protein